MGTLLAKCERSDRGAELGTNPVIAPAIKDPASFLEPLYQARGREKLEMPGHTRLALPGNRREFADREFGLAQNEKQPQPGWVAGGPQHGDELIHTTYKHIFICECKMPHPIGLIPALPPRV